MTMMKMQLSSSWLPFACLWLLLLSSSSCLLTEAKKTTSNVFLHIPQTLMPNSKDGYPHQLARFGLYPQEGSMTHRVYYLPPSSSPNHNFCHDALDFSQGYPRSSTSTNTSLTWVPPFILMVDRSPAENCNFVQMARRGQNAVGASAVVILDDMCVCTHADCNATAPVCAPHEPILVNDGSTNSADSTDIVIPTILIYKTSADQLRNLIQDKNQPLLMELAFGRGNEDQPAAPAGANNDTCQINPIAEYSLWTTPIDPVSVQLFGTFPKVIAELQKQIQEDDYDMIIASILEFSSNHPYLIQGNDAHTSGGDGNDNKENKDGYWHCPTNAACEHVCTNNGRYCTTPTRASTLHGITTLQVVTESLRRACIWKIYHTDESSTPSATDTIEEKVQRATGHIWWSYVSAFTESCFTVDQAKGLDVPSKSADDNSTTPSRFADETCITQAYTVANIDAHLIDECMQESGAIYDNNNNTDTGNSLLDAQAIFQKRHGIHYHPTALVNDMPLAVQAHDAVVSTRTLLRALCSAMERRPGGNALPPLCFNCQWCHDIVGCMQHGGSCDAAWKQQRADEKQRRDDEHKKHDDDHGDHNKAPPSRSGGLVHHFFKVLFIIAVLGMLGYGGWHYYQTRRNGGGGGARNPFGRGGDGNSFLGNYVPLSSGSGGGGDGTGGLFGGGGGGGGGADMGEGGTVQFLSG